MSKNVDLMRRIASGEVSVEEISTSQQIMVALAFENPSFLPDSWSTASEEELKNRLDKDQLSAMLIYKLERSFNR